MKKYTLAGVIVSAGFLGFGVLGWAQAASSATPATGSASEFRFATATKALPSVEIGTYSLQPSAEPGKKNLVFTVKFINPTPYGQWFLFPSTLPGEVAKTSALINTLSVYGYESSGYRLSILQLSGERPTKAVWVPPTSTIILEKLTIPSAGTNPSASSLSLPFVMAQDFMIAQQDGWTLSDLVVEMGAGGSKNVTVDVGIKDQHNIPIGQIRYPTPGGTFEVIFNKIQEAKYTLTIRP